MSLPYENSTSGTVVLEQMDKSISAQARLRIAGGLLANIAYNLAQRVSHQITSADSDALDSARKVWDAAVRALPAAPRPDCPAPAAPATLSIKPWEARRQEYFAQGSVAVRSAQFFKDAEIADWRAMAAAGNSRSQDAAKAFRDAVKLHDEYLADAIAQHLCMSFEKWVEKKVAAMGKQEGGEGA